MKQRHLIWTLLVLMALAAVATRAVAVRPLSVQIHVLDVGQGDAILIELLDGTQILIDGGPDASILSELSSVMGPFDRSIDMVVATHADADHIGGLVDVLAYYDVRYVVDSGIEKDTQLFRAWATAVVQEGAELIVADGIKDLRFSDRATLKLLWPFQPVFGQEKKNVNDYSLVVQFTFDEVDILLTGDIERWTEQQLVSAGVLENVEILKIPHHGSKTSTSAGLLDALNPQLAIISVGHENRYGHPDRGVLARLADASIPTLRTDQEGTITIETDGETFWVKN